MVGTRKYKGGQIVENILKARRSLRRTSHPKIEIPDYNMRPTEASVSSVSLSPQQKWNAQHGKSFMLGKQKYAIYENPETGKPDLYVQEGDSWIESSKSNSYNSFVTPKGLWGGRRRRNNTQRRRK